MISPATFNALQEDMLAMDKLLDSNPLNSAANTLYQMALENLETFDIYLEGSMFLDAGNLRT